MTRAGFAVCLVLLVVTSGWAQRSPDLQWSWRFIAGGVTVGAPVEDSAGRLYFTAEDRFLYALDETGTMHWRTDLERRPTGPIVLGTDGSIYVTLEDGRLVALNKDGRLLWELRLERGGALAPISFTSGLVVASDASGHVIGLTHRGVRVWETDLEDRIPCPPVVDYDAKILVATETGSLLSLNPDGRVTSRRYIGVIAAALAPVEDGILIGTTLGHLIRLDRENEPEWRADLGSAIAELVVDEDGSAYARLDDGSAVRVGEDGVVLWRANPAPAMVRSIVSAHGALISLTGGSIAHLQPDGSLSWQLPLRPGPAKVSLLASGELVVATTDWVTYRYGVIEPSSGPWPRPRGSVENSGRPPGVAAGRTRQDDYEDNLDYIYLAEYVRSDSEDEQLSALREIQDRAAGPNGLADSYSYVVDLCEEVAGTGTVGRVAGDTPVFGHRSRALAISILGEVGDLATARYLVRLLNEEQDADLQGAILEALAALGSGVGGGTVSVVREVLERQHEGVEAEAVARAAVRTIAAIHEYEGGFLNEDGISVLTTIATGWYGNETRSSALQALEDLSRR